MRVLIGAFTRQASHFRNDYGRLFGTLPSKHARVAGNVKGLYVLQNRLPSASKTSPTHESFAPEDVSAMFWKLDVKLSLCRS